MPSEKLARIFDADRAMRSAERELLDLKPAQVAEFLSEAVVAAKNNEDALESALRLERLADLCAQVPGPLMADALLSILDEEEPSVRVAAGEALLEVAYDYYAEVARAIDRALDRDDKGPAMSELPFLLAEVGEPGASKQLKRFLKSSEPEIVAATIEASAASMDVEMLEPLRLLMDDGREVVVEDFDEETHATLGQLAAEAVAALEVLEEE